MQQLRGYKSITFKGEITFLYVVKGLEWENMTEKEIKSPSPISQNPMYLSISVFPPMNFYKIICTTPLKYEVTISCYLLESSIKVYPNITPEIGWVPSNDMEETYFINYLYFVYYTSWSGHE